MVGRGRDARRRRRAVHASRPFLLRIAMAAGLSRFWACAQVVSQMVLRRGVASLAGTDMQLPRRVKIVEVGPRDGLQNEKVSANAERNMRAFDLHQSRVLSFV